MNFNAWWASLQKLARGFNWSLGDQEPYREYFDDGYTPAAALGEEIGREEQRTKACK